MACSVSGCTNRFSKRKPSKKNFFCFPTGDPDRLDEWVHRMGRSDWVPGPSNRVCSDHFEEHHFRTNAWGKTSLKGTAVPTLHLPHPFDTKGGPRSRSFSLVDKIEEVTHGESVHTIPAHQSDVMVTEDKPAFAVPEVPRHNITLAVNSSHSGVSSCSTPQQLVHVCGADHSYSMQTEMVKTSGTDYSYVMTESLRTLIRKASSSEEKLSAARKKLKLKCQQSRRLKARLSSLKKVTLSLKKKLLVSTKYAETLKRFIFTSGLDMSKTQSELLSNHLHMKRVRAARTSSGV